MREVEKNTSSIPIQIRIAVTACSFAIFHFCLVAFSNPNPGNDSRENSAQQRSSEDVRKASAQFNFSAGEKLFASGKYSAAAAAFTLAYETLPHYSVLANIGLSHERAGAYPKAVEFLQKYINALSDRGESNPSMETLLKDTRARVAELVVDVDGFPEGCLIQVDGDRGAEAPLSVMVLPGTHRIRVVHNGEMKAEEQAIVVAGETRNVTITETNRISVSVDTVPDKQNAGMLPRDRDRLQTPFRIAVSSAIGFGVAAGILWGVTLSTKHEFNNLETSEEKEALRPKGERLAVAAPIMTGIAGAATLTAIIIGKMRKTASKKRDANAVSVTVLPGAMNLDVRF